MNAMDVVSNRSLYSAFAELAAHQPDKEWLIFERADESVFRWTYAEFLDSVHRATNLLRSRNIEKGDVVCLHLANHVAYPQLILAASYLGAVVTTSNPASTANELQYVLQHSEAKLLFTQDDCLETARQIVSDDRIVVCKTDERDQTYPVYEEELSTCSTEPPPYRGESLAAAQVLYTSGTTARPKGVVLTNANIIFAVETFRAASGVLPSDRHLVVLPLFHGAAQIQALWVAMIAGASAAIMSRFSASRFFEQAITYQTTLAALFAAPLRMILEQPAQPSDSAHTMRNITFAQNLTQAQYDEWHRRFRVPLQQLWGMTEICSLPLVSPLAGRRNLAAMGRPVLGYELQIIDADGHKVSVGDVGQLIVRGELGRTLMQGYLKDPQATADTLLQGDNGTWLLTGDSVRADEDGFVYFVDRGKDMIKRAGERISSSEIESVLHRCPGVRDACVISVPDPIRDEKIIGIIVKGSDSALTDEEILAFCQAQLSAFKVPQEIVFWEHLPRTSVGKIQKQVVRDQIMERGA